MLLDVLPAGTGEVVETQKYHKSATCLFSLHLSSPMASKQQLMRREQHQFFSLSFYSPLCMGILSVKGNSKLPHYAYVCASTCICMYKHNIFGCLVVYVITAAGTSKKKKLHEHIIHFS